MSGECLHWSDAIRAREGFRGRPGDRSLLFLLTRLPLVPERVLEQLEGLRGGASVYRRLSQLAEQRLLAAIRPSLRPGHEARLWYLTDLGLAVVALDQGCDLGDLVRRNRLRRADLVSRLSGLPQLLAAYDLLGALAASQPGRPDLLAWERPWHRRVWTRLAKAPRSVRFPAYTALAWDGKAGEFILVPDLATIPLRFYHIAIRGLFTLRMMDKPVPVVLIATPQNGRKDAWRDLLEELRHERVESPIEACVVTWAEVCSGALSRVAFPSPDDNDHHRLVRGITVRPPSPPCANSALPRLVGPALTAPQKDRDRDAGVAILGLAALDRALLEFVGCHPFLSIDQLSIAFGRPARTVRRTVNDAIAAGLLRVLEPDECGQSLSDLRVLELTFPGMKLVAAGQGLSLAEAVRFNGLAGGGPGHPIGSRRKLVAQLIHTRGVDEIFVRLIAWARTRTAGGGDDALLEWRNATACARGRVRPDGYGVYRHNGRLYGFFVEYDRGTMGPRSHRQKISAYCGNFESGHYKRDYEGFPTILFVASDLGAEARIARAIEAVGLRRKLPPALLTTTERVGANSEGLLGPIWREAESLVRRRWMRE